MISASYSGGGGGGGVVVVIVAVIVVVTVAVLYCRFPLLVSLSEDFGCRQRAL